MTMTIVKDQYQTGREIVAREFSNSDLSGIEPAEIDRAIGRAIDRVRANPEWAFDEAVEDEVGYTLEEYREWCRQQDNED